MSNQQEIEQRLWSFIEARGGSIREQEKIDPNVFLNNFDRNPPGFRITKSSAAASLLIFFGDPKIAHEALSAGKDMFHEYLQRNQSNEIIISGGKTSVTVKGNDASDYNKAIELFRKAKELEN